MSSPVSASPAPSIQVAGGFIVLNEDINLRRPGDGQEPPENGMRVFDREEGMKLGHARLALDVIHDPQLKIRLEMDAGTAAKGFGTGAFYAALKDDKGGELRIGQQSRTGLLSAERK